MFVYVLKIVSTALRLTRGDVPILSSVHPMCAAPTACVRLAGSAACYGGDDSRGDAGFADGVGHRVRPHACETFDGRRTRRQ